MWRALCTAACGRRVYVYAPTARQAKSAFERYVDALEHIGLERDAWTAHSSNGNQHIRFENGGECRFVSCEPRLISGVSWGQVVYE